MLTPRARGKERGEGKLVREQEAAVEVGVASRGGSRISTDAQSRRESGRSGGGFHMYLPSLFLQGCGTMNCLHQKSEKGCWRV